MRSAMVSGWDPRIVSTLSDDLKALNVAVVVGDANNNIVLIWIISFGTICWRAITYNGKRGKRLLMDYPFANCFGKTIIYYWLSYHHFGQAIDPAKNLHSKESPSKDTRANNNELAWARARAQFPFGTNLHWAVSFIEKLAINYNPQSTSKTHRPNSMILLSHRHRSNGGGYPLLVIWLICVVFYSLHVVITQRLPSGTNGSKNNMNWWTPISNRWKNGCASFVRTGAHK